MRMGIRPGVSTIGGVMKDLPDDWFRPGSHEQPDEDEQHAGGELQPVLPGRAHR